MVEKSQEIKKREQVHDEHVKLHEELTQAIRKRDEYLAGWQRTKADFANYQKEEARRQELMAQFVTTDLIVDLLLVLDSFDLALIQVRNTGEDEKITKGLHLIQSQLEGILRKRGVEEMKALGEKFNPHVHEAVETLHDASKEEGTIVDVLERGYLLHGKVLRPAKVKVVTKLNP